MILGLKNFFSHGIFKGHLFSVLFHLFSIVKRGTHTGLNVLTQKRVPELVLLDGQLACNGCGICTYVCPTDCIDLKADRPEDLMEKQNKDIDISIDHLNCVYCGLCEAVCPVDAIAFGRELNS